MSSTGGCPPGFRLSSWISSSYKGRYPSSYKGRSVLSSSRLRPTLHGQRKSQRIIFSHAVYPGATVFLTRFPFHGPPRASRDRLLREVPSGRPDGGAPQGAPVSVTVGPVAQVIDESWRLLTYFPYTYNRRESCVSLLFTNSRRGGPLPQLGPRYRRRLQELYWFPDPSEGVSSCCKGCLKGLI